MGQRVCCICSCRGSEFRSQILCWEVHNCLYLQPRGICCPLLASVGTDSGVLVHTQIYTHTYNFLFLSLNLLKKAIQPIYQCWKTKLCVCVCVCVCVCGLFVCFLLCYKWVFCGPVAGMGLSVEGCAHVINNSNGRSWEILTRVLPGKSNPGAWWSQSGRRQALNKRALAGGGVNQKGLCDDWRLKARAVWRLWKTESVGNTKESGLGLWRRVWSSLQATIMLHYLRRDCPPGSLSNVLSLCTSWQGIYVNGSDEGAHAYHRVGGMLTDVSQPHHKHAVCLIW
jgi:hypothetical protein